MTGWTLTIVLLAMMTAGLGLGISLASHAYANDYSRLRRQIGSWRSERTAVVRWLDSYASIAPGDDEAYAAGWRMAMFNAAREVERGDHVHADSQP